jgi:hypothetical protein
VPAVLVLALADTLATCGPARPPAVVAASAEALIGLMVHYHNHLPRLTQPPLLTGHQVMEALSLPPGPCVGRWLAHLTDAQQQGLLSSPAEALTWLHAHPFAASPTLLPALP